MPSAKDFLTLGLVARPHGLQGILRVQLFDPASSSLQSIKYVYVGEQANLAKRYAILHAQNAGKGAFLLEIEDCLDRTAAEQLQGLYVFALRKELPPLPSDEAYLEDLIGCEIVQENEILGVVTQIQIAAGQDLLLVRCSHAKQVMIPLIPAFVTKFDIEKRLIFVQIPEGLLELNDPTP